MSSNLEIKSEVFHSFFQLYYNCEPIIFTEQTEPLSIIISVYSNYPNIPLIFECEDNFDKLNSVLDTISSNASVYRQLTTGLNIMKNVDTPLVVVDNVTLINVNKLKNLNKERIDTIYEVLNRIPNGLEIFKTTNNNELLTKYLECKANDKTEKIESIQKEYDNQINLTLQRAIDRAYEDLLSAQKEVTRRSDKYQELLDRQIININKKSTTLQDLIDFSNRNKLIKTATIQTNSKESYISIYTTSFPVEYTCGEEAANRIIYHNTILGMTNQELKDMIYDAITARTRYVILHDPIKLNITLDNNNISTWDAKHYTYVTCLRSEWTSDSRAECNVHYFRYGCLGGFSNDMTEATRTNNIKRLIATILQYFATINIADTAGVSWATTSRKIIKDLQTNKILLVNLATNTQEDITENYTKYYDLELKDLKAYNESRGILYVEHKI